MVNLISAGFMHSVKDNLIILTYITNSKFKVFSQLYKFASSQKNKKKKEKKETGSCGEMVKNEGAELIFRAFLSS